MIFHRNAKRNFKSFSPLMKIFHNFLHRFEKNMFMEVLNLIED